MDRSLPQRASGVSAAVHLAETLLAKAEACPALIIRSRPVPAAPTLTLLSDPVLDVRPYLEHLVSRAAVSARQSEVLALQASRLNRKARRQTLMVGCIGVGALLIVVVGFLARRALDVSFAHSQSHPILQSEQQQQTAAAIVPSAARPSDTRAAEIDGRWPMTSSASAAALPTFNVPSIRYYAQPWPDSRRRTLKPNRRATNPHFIAGFAGRFQAVLR